MFKTPKPETQADLETDPNPIASQRRVVGTSKHCGRCKSTNTRKSKVRNVFEALVRIFGFNYHRCRGCGHRFLRFL